MAQQNINEFHDNQYRRHSDGQIVCQNSVHDLCKAQRRVQNVLSAFGIVACGKGVEVLDVGCGLGYYSGALAADGAR